MVVLRGLGLVLPMVIGAVASGMSGAALGAILKFQPGDCRAYAPFPHLVTAASAAAPDFEWRT